MTPRLALRFVLVALIAAFLIVTAGLAVGRLGQQLNATPADVSQLTEAQLAAGLMPLDSAGNGAQVIGDTRLNVRAQPYPALAGEDAELRLVVISPTGQVLTNLRPTAFLARAGSVEGTTRELVAQTDGTYLLKGRLYSQPGTYRVRITVPPGGRAAGGEFDYVVLLSIDAR